MTTDKERIGKGLREKISMPAAENSFEALKCRRLFLSIRRLKAC